jgi:hypothetical protein
MQSMWVIVSDREGVVDQEIVLPSHVVSHHYYWEVLQHLRWQVCQKMSTAMAEPRLVGRA